MNDNEKPWINFQIKNSDEMRYTNPNDLVYIYKRLNDSLKYVGDDKLDLIDKRFKVSSNKEIIDTAYFKNDSIISWSSRLKNTGANKWIVHNISGYKILSIQELGQSAIYKTENDRVFLKCFEKAPIDLMFEELE